MSGSIAVEGGRERIAYLPQAAEIDRSFPISVYDLVAMGLWRRTGLFGAVGREDRARIDEALAAVGLTGFERRPIGTLSGGQMQRVLFARLLLQDAGVILLDEPFTAIDARTAADLHRRSSAAGTPSGAPSSPCCTTSTSRGRCFPETLLIAREAGRLGADRRGADAGQPRLQARRMLEAYDPARAAACVRRPASSMTMLYDR